MQVYKIEQYTTIVQGAIETTITTLDSHNNVLSTKSATCSTPDYVSTLNRTEGVVVGEAGGLHVTFAPIKNNVLMSGQIFLYSSNTNLFSSVLGTETAESSNLYQTSVSYGGQKPYYVDPYEETGAYCESAANSGSNGGSVSYWNQTTGSPDGLYGHLGAPNPGDSAFVLCDLGAFTSGTFSIDGFSYNNHAGAYYSQVEGETSKDGKTWSAPIYNQQWQPSSNNQPAWITIGSVSNIRYLKMIVLDSQGLSGSVYIDSAEVT